MCSLRLAPGIPDLQSLGAERAEDWFGDGRALVTGTRVEVLSRTRTLTVARVPLPGTPDAGGSQHESPRGAGTGHMILRVWRGGGAELLRARLGEPRITSLAARRWNLICHLAASGVGAPALVAMGERGAGESFLLERELDGFESLARLAARPLEARRRARVVRSVGLALRALFRARAWLPALTPEGLLVQRAALDGSHEGADVCAAIEVRELQAERGVLEGLRVRRTRLPAVAFVELRNGRLLRRVSAARRARLLRALERALPVGPTPLEAARVQALARPERVRRAGC
jgi:hypothetical protein